MARISSISFNTLKSPVVITGLFYLLLTLTACNAKQTPAEVTNAFWNALAANDVATARQYTTQNSSEFVVDTHGLDLQYTALHIGEIRINGQHASVETQFIYQTNASQKPDLHFKTYLLQEHGDWNIDYQQTLINIPGRALSDLFKNLQTLGKIFSRQLEQQLPVIEEQIEEFSKQLNEQIEEFNRELEKSMPKQETTPYNGSV